MSELFTLHAGDCRASMAAMPAESVQTCVTSPPYYSLRDYGCAGQIGLEASLGEYVGAMVSVFDAVRRVLRGDGTLWLNLGDSYANDAKSESSRPGPSLQGNENLTCPQRDWRGDGFGKKNLMGVPWRVAFALQEAGWVLRQDIIWHKPNPMPESVTDRCTKAHEYVFLLAKRPAYYFDNDAIKEKAVGEQSGAATMFKREDSKRAQTIPGQAYGTHRPDREAVSYNADTRNRRSVWPVATTAYKEAHFATFPVALPTRCILAGTSAEGCCPACGSPWVRVVERERVATRPGTDTKATGVAMVDGNRDPRRHVTTAKTVGWRAGCACAAGDPVPCTVLDCFSGAATTGVAAIQTGRRYVGCELNADYLAMSERRLRKAVGNPSLFHAPANGVPADAH